MVDARQLTMAACWTPLSALQTLHPHYEHSQRPMISSFDASSRWNIPSTNHNATTHQCRRHYGEVDGNINIHDGASALKDFMLALHNCLVMMVIYCGVVSLMDLELEWLLARADVIATKDEFRDLGKWKVHAVMNHETDKHGGSREFLLQEYNSLGKLMLLEVVVAIGYEFWIDCRNFKTIWARGTRRFELGTASRIHSFTRPAKMVVQGSLELSSTICMPIVPQSNSGH